MARTFYLFILIVSCVLLPCETFVYAEYADPSVRIVQTTGDVVAINRQKGISRPLVAEDSVHQGERIVTGPKAKATIDMNGDLLIHLAEKAVLDIENFNYFPESRKGSIGLQILKGSLRMATHSQYDVNRRPLLLKTPSAHVGVRGTRFWLNVAAQDESPQPSNTLVQLLCLKPTCVISNDVNQQVMDRPNEVVESRSRFEALPNPRKATPEELDYVHSLTPGFPNDSDPDKTKASWFSPNSPLGPGGPDNKDGNGGSGENSPASKKDIEKPSNDGENLPLFLILMGVAGVLGLLAGLFWWISSRFSSGSAEKNAVPPVNDPPKSDGSESEDSSEQSENVDDTRW